MYQQVTRTSRRKNLRVSMGTSQRKRPTKQNQQEKVRLLQLFICLVLFLAVVIGKGVFPNKLTQVRDEILTMLSTDIDFRSAFSTLGESLSEKGAIWGELGDFCVEVFGPTETPEPSIDEENDAIPQFTSLMASESLFFSQNPDSSAIAEHFLNLNGTQTGLWSAAEEESSTTAPSTSPQPQTEVIAAAGTVLLKSDYSGQALPTNYTMDQLSLGDLETVTPVLGHINSVYGYRDHPINGKYQFHGGVDIGGQMGDPIKAFAAGTVEYVGEDDSYGLYFQLDHGNGVKSFYAHCSVVCVKKGEQVSLGQKVAEVGASGAATGPHLHLELKWNSTHLNPIYYIEYLTDQ